MVSDLPWAFSAAWDHLSCLNVGREWKILFCRRLTANSFLSVIMKPQITWAGLNSFGKLNTDGCSWPSDLLCLVWLRLCYFSSWFLNKEMRLQLVKYPSIFPVRKPHSLGVRCIYPYVICYSQVSAKMDSLVRACVAAFLSLTADSKWYTGLWWMWPQARPRRRTVCQVKSPEAVWHRSENGKPSHLLCCRTLLPSLSPAATHILLGRVLPPPALFGCKSRQRSASTWMLKLSRCTCAPCEWAVIVCLCC